MPVSGSIAAPDQFAPPPMPGIWNRAALRRRRKQRPVIVFGNDIDRLLVDLRRQIDQVLIADAPECRSALVWWETAVSSTRSLRRTRSTPAPAAPSIGHNRLAGDAIEHIHKRLFCDFARPP